MEIKEKGMNKFERFGAICVKQKMLDDGEI